MENPEFLLYLYLFVLHQRVIMKIMHRFHSSDLHLHQFPLISNQNKLSLQLLHSPLSSYTPTTLVKWLTNRQETQRIDFTRYVR